MGSKIIFTIKMPQEELKFFEKVKYFMLKRKIERLKKKGKNTLVTNTRYTLAMAKLEKEGIILHYSIDEKTDEKTDKKTGKKTDKKTGKKVVSWISW